MNIIDRLKEDAEHHREIAQDCDCNPVHTVNWQHALNCEEAAARIQELEAQAREHIEQIRAERNCARKAEQERDAARREAAEAQAKLQAIQDEFWRVGAGWLTGGSACALVVKHKANYKALTAAIEEARAEEREACIEHVLLELDGNGQAEAIILAIRARGKS